MLQKKFVIVKEVKTVAARSAHCKSLGGTLALPESVEENQRIMDELSNILHSLHFLIVMLTLQSFSKLAESLFLSDTHSYFR